jgi:hypothetical protein
MHAYMGYVYKGVRIHTHTCIHIIHTHIHTCDTVRMRRYAYIHTYTYTYVHTYIHTYTHVTKQECEDTHTYIHTHIHISFSLSQSSRRVHMHLRNSRNQRSMHADTHTHTHTHINRSFSFSQSSRRVHMQLRKSRNQRSMRAHTHASMPTSHPVSGNSVHLRDFHLQAAKIPGKAAVGNKLGRPGLFVPASGMCTVYV